MKRYGRTAAILIRTLLHILCKVDSRELKKIPAKGPYIIVFNHINFLEVPLIFVDLQPRKIHGVAKKETWDNPIFSWIADRWNTISVNREGFSGDTFKQIKKLLHKGRMIVIAPEGTRSGDGKLKQAHPGVIAMAQQSQVPIIPLVHYGGEKFWENLVRFKRTRFTYRVGQPVNLTLMGKSRSARQEAVNQLMLRMAALLPEKYRGYYSQISKINDKYIKEITL